MNTGAPAGMPSGFIHSAWPTRARTAAHEERRERQPHSSVYAPTETTIVTAVVTKLNFATAKSTSLSLRIHWNPITAAATIGPPMRRAHMRSELWGWIGRSS